MTARKSGLGRGLDALLPADRPDEGFATLALDSIVPNPDQPRHHFDDGLLEALAASIREVGILQPIVVRPLGANGAHTLVTGERRLRAASLAGLTEIPAVIRAEAGEGRNLTEALVENIQREDLGPLEEATGYRQLLEDFGWTHDQVAQRVGKSRPSVTNSVRLLQLPAAIQGMLERGELAAGHVRPLLTVDDEVFAIYVAAQAAEEGWSVRQVEEAVRARTADEPEPEQLRSAAPLARPAAIIELEDRLSEHLGSKVKISYGERGGKIIVGYRGLDDLERIYRRIFGG